MINSLQRDFELRKRIFSNRASAIFPIFFLKIDNDLILSFLNYWTIKNNIDARKISINLRIYDAYGQLIVREILALDAENNFVSMRNYLKEIVFQGMVEIEIISTCNIGYTFPAIVGFYKSGSLYSCVHSAGRIKGSDENHTSTVFEETNWSCKFGSSVSPFFHYVNGCNEESVNLTINLYEKSGDAVTSRRVVERLNAFASKIYFIDELFPDVNFEDGMYVGVVCNNDSVFRRMVVGNYHKKLKHLEVTHSFPKQESIDFCPENENGYESILAMYTDENLTLKCRVFPTNCSNHFNVAESKLAFSDKVLGNPSDTTKLSEGFGLIEQDNDVRMSVLWLSGSKVPSRLNTNFIYMVKGVDSIFSTDIATGAKSSVYPPKFSHWGSGVFGNGYNFALM